MSMSATTPQIPRLEPGDYLTREEFHRRYLAHPVDVKAELIDGVVYMPSPARRNHGRFQQALSLWLGSFALSRPGIEALVEVSVLLGHDREARPDLLLRRLEGGTSTIDADEYLVGPPELVVEVAYSSSSYDLHQKRAMYEDAGASEYLVLDVAGRRVHWWRLVEGAYVPLTADADGVLESVAYPGLRLDVAALLDHDGHGLLAALAR